MDNKYRINVKGHIIFESSIRVEIFKRGGWYFARPSCKHGEGQLVGPFQYEQQAYEEGLKKGISEYPLFKDKYINNKKRCVL